MSLRTHKGFVFNVCSRVVRRLQSFRTLHYLNSFGNTLRFHETRYSILLEFLQSFDIYVSISERECKLKESTVESKWLNKAKSYEIHLFDQAERKKCFHIYENSKRSQVD